MRAQGQQYVSGYGVREESTKRHDAAANKNYTLKEVARLRNLSFDASIDYPRCLLEEHRRRHGAPLVP